MPKVYTSVKYLLVLFVVALMAASGCNIINPAEPTPTYVHIDSFHMKSNGKDDGSLSQNINSVWVFYNNNPVGVFDLPCTVPVITSGASGSLELAPAIADNGLNNFEEIYPFYTLDTSTLISQPGKTVIHEPVTGYTTEGTSVTQISYFESATLFGIYSGDVGFTLDTPAFEGAHSGVMTFSSVGDSSEDSSFYSFNIPISGESFIEFNYKSTIPFYVGLRANFGYGIYNKNYLAGISPSSTWKKFYLATGDFAATNQGIDYKFFVKAGLGSGQPSGKVWMDNIKLVTVPQ